MKTVELKRAPLAQDSIADVGPTAQTRLIEDCRQGLVRPPSR